MGERERGRHVVAVADEPHAIPKAGSLDAVLKLLPVGVAPLGVAREDEHGLTEFVRRAQPLRRVDDIGLPLPARQPGGVQDDRLAFA